MKRSLRRRWSVALLATVLLFSTCVSPVFGEIMPDPIRYRKETVGGGERVVFTNTCAAPVSIKLQMTSLSNVSVSGPSDLIEVPANGSVTGPTFYPTGKPWKYKWTYRYNFGSYRASEPNEAFELPWAVGESRKAGQAFGGDRSHSGDDRYAVDFPMPEGTELYAARAGLVCYVRENFTEGGWNPELRDKDNHILIAHEDGTISRYLHLRPQGAEVELGDWVEAGQFIGYSGNVGYSSGPHLHFDVVRPGTDLVTQTIPFQLLSDGVPVTPAENMILSH